MPTLTRPPIATDQAACLVAGVWAGFYPDATVRVTVGWLAGVMERLDPTPADLAPRTVAAMTFVDGDGLDPCVRCDRVPDGLVGDWGQCEDCADLAAEADEDEARDVGAER